MAVPLGWVAEMKMISLAQLHRSMREIGVDIQKFGIKTGAAEFDCLFSTRSDPFHLALTSVGENPLYLGFEVRPGYNLNPYLGNKYQEVLRLLYIDGRSSTPFKVTEWFLQIDGQIPKQATSRIPHVAEIVRLRPDIEEADKIHFLEWRYHTKGSVTRKNLEKTDQLIGAEAGEHSRKFNASSCWSAVDAGKNWRSSMRR